MVRGSPTMGVIEDGVALMEGLATTTPVVTELVSVTVGAVLVPVVMGMLVVMVFIGAVRPETGSIRNVATRTRATTIIAEYMDFFIREF